MGCASSSDKGRERDLAAMKAVGDISDTRSKKGDATLGKRAQHFHLYRDKFKSIGEVSTDLQTQGLAQARLVLAIDLTKANQWSGMRSFHGAEPACLPCLLGHTVRHARQRKHARQPTTHTPFCCCLTVWRHVRCRPVPALAQSGDEPLQNGAYRAWPHAGAL